MEINGLSILHSCSVISVIYVHWCGGVKYNFHDFLKIFILCTVSSMIHLDQFASPVYTLSQHVMVVRP